MRLCGRLMNKLRVGKSMKNLISIPSQKTLYRCIDTLTNTQGIIYYANKHRIPIRANLEMYNIRFKFRTSLIK